MADFETLKWAKIDFTKNLSGREIFKVSHCDFFLFLGLRQVTTVPRVCKRTEVKENGVCVKTRKRGNIRRKESVSYGRKTSFRSYLRHKRKNGK